MRTLIKILAWIVGSLVVLVLLAALALTALFDPNDYKDDIVAAVKSATGRELRIDGKIGWTLWPRIGVSLKQLSLSNAAGFGKEPFASVDAVTVSVEVLPLLKQQINVDAVLIDGLTLKLAKNAAGRTNWEDLAGDDKAGAPKPKPAPETQSPAAVAFAVGMIDISDATITWHDQSTGDRYAVRNLSIETGPVALDRPIDIAIRMQIEHGKPVQRVPLTLNATIAHGKDKFGLKPFTLTLGDSTLKGSAEILNPANPAYRFDLSLDQFDLDRYLPPAPQTDTAATSDTADENAAPVEIPVGVLRALDVQGKLSIGRLKAFGIRSQDIRTQISARGGDIALGPSSASLYGGTYQGDVRIDVRGKTPQLKLNEKLTKVDLGAFLKDAQVFDHFGGAANLSLALAAAGGDAQAITRTLTGNVAVSIDNGAIEGIDVVKLENQIKEARQEAGNDLKKLLDSLPELKPAPGDKTEFKKLSATAKLTNGVVNNDDLTIEGPHVHVRGSGKVDLVRNEFDDYLLRVSEIPLYIDGPFASPKVRPDWNAIVKKAASEKVEQKKQEVKKEIEKKKDDTKDRLKKKLRDRLER